MGEIDWRDNWPSAQKAAQKIDRRILVELYMDECPHCARLHAETHTDDKVAEMVNSKFVPVRLEVRSNMDIAKQFNVTAEPTAGPTTLVISGDGKELHRFSGYRSPLEYLEELEKAL
jgi:uncharacterized protein YyaL (SSP411 family)